MLRISPRKYLRMNSMEEVEAILKGRINFINRGLKISRFELDYLPDCTMIVTRIYFGRFRKIVAIIKVDEQGQISIKQLNNSSLSFSLLVNLDKLTTTPIITDEMCARVEA